MDGQSLGAERHTFELLAGLVGLLQRKRILVMSTFYNCLCVASHCKHAFQVLCLVFALCSRCLHSPNLNSSTLGILDTLQFCEKVKVKSVSLSVYNSLVFFMV